MMKFQVRDNSSIYIRKSKIEIGLLLDLDQEFDSVLERKYEVLPGFTDKEIAYKLKISKSAVCLQKKKAIERLKDSMDMSQAA